MRSVKDLKGKKVVVSSAKGSIAEYLLAHALQQAGLSYDDVKV
ncbi:ABC transporter substrate-binding protein [Streptomyces coeruleorubidus]